MTDSDEKRRQEMREMLTLFLHDLGDDSIRLTTYGTNEPEYQHFMATTWAGLKEMGFLDSEFDTFGEDRTYNLTVSGYIKALEISGQLHSPQLRERALVLVRYLKRSIAGRHDPDGTILDPAKIAIDTDLPMGWVFNAILSNLLTYIFPRGNMDLELNSDGDCVRVPSTFAQNDINFEDR